MRRLLALLLASSLAAVAAVAAEPSCEGPAVEVDQEQPAGDDCGDCGEGCLDCACCRAPVAIEARLAGPAAPQAGAPVACEPPPLEGVRPPGGIFQPPRA